MRKLKTASRRDFLRKTALAGSALLVADFPLLAFNGSPNEKLVVGVMGTNSRGEYLASLFSALPNVEVGAICDVDSKVLAKTIALIEKKTGKKPKAFTDVRKMLESKDIDALVAA
ncbi:MAG TPA: twin-arginine translocation signal domain-containing protein, partial [Flavihumibacter sp.]|nr:twin-arginine translocation signal domain-containing protein [Flavihumibacter sp.]